MRVLLFGLCALTGCVDEWFQNSAPQLVSVNGVTVSPLAGIPEGAVSPTRVLPLADADAVRQLFAEAGDQLAAVIVEPMPANNGLLLQEKAFLELDNLGTVEFK